MRYRAGVRSRSCRPSGCLRQAVLVAAPGLLATVAVSKYCDHLPLYRQEMIFKTRHGVSLPRSTLARWMAHARRHFHEAREHVPLRANWVLYQIQNLCRIEARLRETKAGPALRAAVRSSQSAMILSRLKRALEKMEASQRHLPASTFGKAISYTLSHWELLTKYVANGRIEIDNNGVLGATLTNQRE